MNFLFDWKKFKQQKLKSTGEYLIEKYACFFFILSRDQS